MTGRRTASRKLSTAFWRWVGADRPVTGIATKRLICCLAGLATPLVLSVHTVVSFDFAVGYCSGMARDDFPALLRGRRHLFGLRDGLMLAIPMRKFYDLEDFITDRHLQNMAKVMLATGWIVAYGYGMEAFMGWYSGNKFDPSCSGIGCTVLTRVWYWALLDLQHRHSAGSCFPEDADQSALALVDLVVVLIGMWLERFIIVVVSLHRDFVTSSWGMYYPTKWDWMTFIGTMGMFLAAMFLFMRFLPMISIFEMRTLLPEAEVKE